jgi:predicted  nucleic acid-binding Zn-ribbon protein
MAIEADELAARLQRISKLTERLRSLQAENADARKLAERISQEITAAREHLKRPPPPKK